MLRSLVFVAVLVGSLFVASPVEGNSPSSAKLTVVRPSSTSAVDPRNARGKPSRIERTEIDPTLDIAPGKILIYSANSPNPLASIKADSGQSIYFVNDRDAFSLRRLADVLLEGGNRVAAHQLYRTALSRDSSLADVWKRYAELSAESGNIKEAQSAFSRVLKMGNADAYTFQVMGDLNLASNRHTEAQSLYERSLEKDPASWGAMMGLGYTKFKTGDAAGAITIYENALRIHPDSIRVHRLLGDACLANQDTARGMTSYRLFFEKGGSDNASALAVGRYEFNARRFENAIRYLSMIQGNTAQSLECLMLLGVSYHRVGRHADAIASLRTAANKYPAAPSWSEIVELLIQSYIARQENDKARFWVDKYAATVKGPNREISFLRAYLQEKNSPAKSVALYEKNITTFPADYRNYLRLGLLFAKSKSTAPRALELVAMTVKLIDTIPEAWLEIARIHRELGRTDEELQALQVFIVSDPQHPEANARMGELMVGRGKTGEGLKRLETAQKAGADNPAVVIALAKAYMNSGKLPEAIQTLEKGKSSFPTAIEMRRGLVDLYTRTSATEKAIAELKGILEIQQDSPTLLLYASHLLRAGDLSGAVDALENIRATDPENTEMLLMLAKVRRMEKKYQQAIELYQEVLSIRSGYLPALYERAETHLESGQPHWAAEFYGRALKQDPGFVLAEVGLAKVAQLRKDKATFNKHIERARKIDPRNQELMKVVSQGI